MGNFIALSEDISLSAGKSQFEPELGNDMKKRYNYWISISKRYRSDSIYIVRYPVECERYIGPDEYLTRDGKWLGTSPPETLFNSARWALSVFYKTEGRKKIDKRDLLAVTIPGVRR